MPLGRGPKFHKKMPLKAESLNAVSARGAGVFVAGRGGFRRIGSGGGVSYTPPRSPLVIRPILAKITGNESIGDNRWKYTWTEQSVSAGEFSDKISGRTGTLTDGFAVNGIEASNSTAGIQGNGIDLDGQVFTDNALLEVKPAATNAVVLLHVFPDPAGGKSYVFFYENAIDGECA